jgi:excinuclease ABC subunit C
MVRALPRGPGVYRFRDRDDAVMYVGRAAHLRDRVASYWSDLRDRHHLPPMVDAITRIEAVTCASRHEAAWLERNLLQDTLPPWNRTPGGQEVPVAIGIDDCEPAPDLHVTHLPLPPAHVATYFGPYLGGLQIRRAVTGLHRLYPLRYTGTGLTASAQAMAAERGITRRDRKALVESLTALLQRDPAAIRRARADLMSLRQRAAGQEAFELAGRVHRELQAVDWISSPQRVTTLTAEDADVIGIHGNTMVHFAVRAGRLSQWSARRCTPRSAAPRAEATPTRWRAFAQRNAELAAALDHHSHLG